MTAAFGVSGFGYKTTEQVVQAPYALIKGDLPLRAVLDLSAPGIAGAELFLTIGTGGTTSLTNGVTAHIIPLFAGTSIPQLSTPLVSFQSRLTCGARQINLAAGYAAGSQSFVFDGSGGTGFAVGEKLLFWGVNAIPIVGGLLATGATPEVLAVSKGTTTPVTTLEPCKFAKIDNEWFSQADCFGPVWVRGGGSVTVLFDYGDDSAGEAVLCMAHAKIYTGPQKVSGLS
jgi:hypothetical protein